MLYRRRFGIAGLVVALAVLLAFAMAPATALAEKPIKIGLIDCYTGGAAAFTKPALAAWKMVVAEFNAKGGLKGRKIELLTRDSKFKADEALGHARELILKENVDFLGGTVSSSAALAVSEFARKKKKLLIIHISRSHRITGEKGHNYVFRACPSAAIEGLAGGAYAAQKPLKKWYIIGDDYEYGHSIADNFWKGLKKNKPEVVKVGEAWPKLRETDYTPYLTALVAKKPDAVYAAFGASGLISFMKQAKLFGLFEKFPVFAFALGDSLFPKVLKREHAHRGLRWCQLPLVLPGLRIEQGLRQRVSRLYREGGQTRPLSLRNRSLWGVLRCQVPHRSHREGGEHRHGQGDQSPRRAHDQNRHWADQDERVRSSGHHSCVLGPNSQGSRIPIPRPEGCGHDAARQGDSILQGDRGTEKGSEEVEAI